MDGSASRPGCPACGSDAYGRFLIVSLRSADGPAHMFEPVGDVWLRCVRCRHEDRLGHNLLVDAYTELDEIRRGLEYETGLPVFIDPPDDPPAGVREPRQPPPDGGTFAARLEVPRD